MTMQGSLAEMTVADLIQHACMDGRTTCITLRRDGEDAASSIYIENGELVHAEMGGRVGEEVVFDMLGWQEGSFALETDVPSPAHTIDRPYTGVLLEGMQRIDDRAAAEPDGSSLDGGGMDLTSPVHHPATNNLADLVASLGTIQGVSGVVIAAIDGVVIAHNLETNPDKNGAIAVFVGMAARQMSDVLSLGSFHWATVVTGKDKTLVIEQPDFFIGLQLSKKASPALVASQAQGMLC